jgi:hypothetical protein
VNVPVWMVPIAATFLNGVALPADALSGLDLTSVDLRVDASGDVHITAPGYAWARDRLVVSEQAQTRSAAEWVVLFEDVGSNDMELSLYIGDVRVKRLNSGSGSLVVAVDDLVQPGKNTIRVEVSSGDRATGRMAVTVAEARRVGGAFVLPDSPSRYLVQATQRGDLTFDVTR